MMENSYSLLFFLKSSKNERKSVYARIRVGGVPKEFSTKYTWPESRWDTRKGKPIGNKEDAAVLSKHLDALDLKIKLARIRLMEKGQEVTAHKLKLAALDINPDDHTLIQEFVAYNGRLQKLVEKGEYAEGTLSNFETTLLHTKAYLEMHYRLPDLSITKVDYQFISNMEHWFKTTKGCNHNTTVKYLANLKQVMQECFKRELLEKEPFYKYKLARKEVHVEALEEWEIEKIWNQQFETERLTIVRDIFIFSCFTGMAYADVKKLHKDQLHLDANGKEWISSARQKSKTAFRIPLFSIANEIITRYKGHDKCLETGKVLPIFSNQKMNEFLKEIAAICGISKKLTFHLARHTFATTVTLNNGVPIETVSKLLGHKTIKQTQHYARVLDSKLVEDLSKVEGRFGLASKAPCTQPDIPETALDFAFSYDIKIHLSLSNDEFETITRAIEAGDSSYENQVGGFWHTILKQRIASGDSRHDITVCISELDRIIVRSLESYLGYPAAGENNIAKSLSRDLFNILRNAIDHRNLLNGPEGKFSDPAFARMEVA